MSAVPRPEVRALVLDHLASVLGLPPGAPAAAGSLFDLPGFDSIAIVDVLDRLETALGVEVPPELIVPEAFESLDSLTALLASAADSRTPR